MAMLADQAEAEDVVQETLLAAYQTFGSWRRESSVRAWLCGIARNKALQRLERHKRRTRRLRLVADNERSEAGAEAFLELRQKAESARAAIERIRPSEREALLLRYVAELDFSEIAKLCGTTEPTVRKRISRGLASLREQVRRSEEP
jgi:RNA polymerase sigma-70 factor (ECF subfamily)